MLEIKNTHPLGNIENASPEISGVTLEVKTIPALVQLFAKKGQGSALEKKLKLATVSGYVSQTPEFTAFPFAPDQWILVSKKDTGSAFADQISKSIASIGYVSEQSESRVCIRISGPKAIELMSRGCQLDLHPNVASAGYCAQTTMAQIGVLLHVVDDEPIYELYIYSGFARSFWHWLTETAQQFGCEVVNNSSASGITR